MHRIKAAGLHLLASFLLVLTIFAFVNMIWYPGPLFRAANGKDIMMILLIVDLIIGPLLTLIVFDVKKPSLKFDILVILFIQLICIIYGLFVIHSARPVFIVYVEDKFRLVTANEIEPEDLKLATRKEFRTLPIWGPKAVAAVVPSSSEINEKLAIAAFAGLGPQHFPELYVPLEEAEGFPESLLIEHKKLDRHSKELDSDIKKSVYIPLNVKSYSLYVAISLEDLSFSVTEKHP